MKDIPMLNIRESNQVCSVGNSQASPTTSTFLGSSHSTVAPPHHPNKRCDPECLVQPPNSWSAPKSIGEGASSLFGGRPGSPENVSCSRATPRLHRCKSGVAPEQETFSGLPGQPPKRPLAPSPIDLGALQEFGGCTRHSGSQNKRPIHMRHANRFTILAEMIAKQFPETIIFVIFL